MSTGGADSCSDMMQEPTGSFRTQDGEWEEEGTRAGSLLNNRLFYERQQAARNGNRDSKLSWIRRLAADYSREKEGGGERLGYV